MSRRDSNQQAILTTLRERGPMLAYDLGRTLGRQPAPLLRDLKALEADGLIVGEGASNMQYWRVAA